MDAIGICICSSRLTESTVVSLRKALYRVLSTGTNQEDMMSSRYNCNIVDWDVKQYLNINKSNS